YYMGRERFAEAAELYSVMLEEAPEDSQILAFAAQAEFLAAGRKLSDHARLLAEQALAANPHQGTALGLLGMASFEEGKYRAAVAYWERLLVMEQPGSESARLIEDVIAQAKAQLGEGEGALAAHASPATPTTPQVSSPGVTVSVRLPEGGAVNPGDTVFVLARNADGASRMPLAVQRLRGSQLPLTLRLDDSSSMAGQKLSAVASVIVAVQVSPDGRPGEDGASWLGEAGPLAPSLEPEPVEIVLAPTQGS
ncbi:MAG: cytochrome C biogenesis protein, partial [Halioglobus sp.]|nr:cytochrome C biogenesis protein [Halioglobus sp.]